MILQPHTTISATISFLTGLRCLLQYLIIYVLQFQFHFVFSPSDQSKQFIFCEIHILNVSHCQYNIPLADEHQVLHCHIFENDIYPEIIWSWLHINLSYFSIFLIFYRFSITLMFGELGSYSKKSIKWSWNQLFHTLVWHQAEKWCSF